MELFPYLLYRATPKIGGGELIAGFRERQEAVNYLNYAKLLDKNGGDLYIKEADGSDSRIGQEGRQCGNNG